MKYKVIWEIEIEEDSIVEAANLAFDIIQEEGASAIFNVIDENGVEEKVEVSELKL